MIDYLALPPARAVRGAVQVPPSKSWTNRALLLAALRPEPVEILRPLDSQDTRALASCLAAMGASIERTPDGLRVHGPLRGSASSDVVLDAESSGTAARFLAALTAVVPGRWRLTGSARLLERPMAELVQALRSAGARVEFAGREGQLPLRIEGGGISAREVTVDASRSGQFFSALLLAGAALDGGLSVRPSGPVASSPYVETTVETLSELGWLVRRAAGGAIVVGAAGSAPRAYEVPGDWSSALPLLAAAGIAGGEVSVTGLPWPSRDADATASESLESAGLEIERDARAVRARGDPRQLRPVSVRASEFPDAVPVLAAVAAFAAGESVFEGIAHLRGKESDRVAALASLVEAAGGFARSGEAELVVAGPPRALSGALLRLPTFDDHRIAMAAALLSLRVPQTLLERPGCVSKSYPAFFRDLETILVRG